MNLVIPKVDIWEQNDIWSNIARCTRVCYQSTPKNDGETDEEFVKRVIFRINKLKGESTDKYIKRVDELSSTGELNWDNLHGAMLEHGTVYLKAFENNEGHFVDKYENNKYSRVYCIKPTHGDSSWVTDVYVTTNLRVIYENNWLDDLKYICAPIEYHTKRVTVSFTTNAGVSREFNRHRVNSIAEESTRYCNYAKPRQISNINSTLGFGTIVNDIMPINGQMRFGLPAWLLDDENIRYIEHHADDELHSYCTDIADGNDTNWCDIDYYLFALNCAEYCYNNLIRKGWKPQQAREVLPFATKSQLIHTAFIDDWKHFFALRADGVSGPPHPNAKLVAAPLKEEFIKRGYI